MNNGFVPDVPQQRPSSPALDVQAALHALGRSPQPIAPPGPAGALTDRVLVHASFEAGSRLLDLLPADVSGLVLRGAQSLSGMRKLRRAGYKGALVHDPEGYVTAAATEEDPFALPKDGLFDVSLNEVLQYQIDSGATVAMSPTGYFFSGDATPIKVAGKVLMDLGREDVLFNVPLDIAWFTNDNFPQLLAVMKRIALPKVVMLGGQFNPPEKYKPAFANLRRLVAEGGNVAIFRTDLAAFDAMCHGAFAASIGTGGSLRHIVPFGKHPRAGKKDKKEPPDLSPSVLLPELMTFYKGSLLADRLANAPKRFDCDCASCNGRALSTFIDKTHSEAAHAHGVHTWSPWLAEIRAQRDLLARAEWWQERCAAAIKQVDIVNAEIEQFGAFEPKAPLKAWANLPAWATASAPQQSPTP
jgi:hypothetical protein